MKLEDECDRNQRCTFSGFAGAVILSLVLSSCADIDNPLSRLTGVFGETVETAEGTLRQGQTLKDCAECPEMVVIAPGMFRMGDISGEGTADELPVHQVTVAYPFAVGKYEVTQQLWETVIGTNPSAFQDPDHPVERVSWRDAKAFIQRLNQRTGQTYRLLTEAEWEYVARADSETLYPWGDGPSRNRANCVDCGSAWDNLGTAPVGSFTSNAFNVYDMQGNVWEWVEDCTLGTYEGAPDDGSAISPERHCLQVLRGGGWTNRAKDLRVSVRSWSTPSLRVNYAGLRLARTLAPPSAQ